ncbi:MAG: TonB-dependent receptor [Agriterribacter sp.]
MNKINVAMKYVFVPFLLLIVSNICAQNISGTIYSEDGKAVVKATVSLLQAKDSSELTSTITDESGNFQLLNVLNGIYIIRTTAVSYATNFSAAFKLNNSNYLLPTIILKKEAAILSNVTVTAKRPPVEVKAGKTVVNVDASPTNAGLNVLEILEKSPGVSVDNDGNVSLKGKGGVMILIDGKQTYLSGESLAAFLKSIQANQLDQIEIMTNPPAKYDAAGGAGIINIKTKKGMLKGINGNANFNYAQGFYPKYNGGVNFNYRNNKVNVFGGYNGGVWEGLSLQTINKYFYKEEVFSGLSEQQTDRHNKASWHNMKLGADYSFTKKDVIGVVVNSSINPWNSWQKGNIYLKDAERNLNTVLMSDAQNGNKSQNITTNLNYKHSFDSTGKELSADFDYGYYKSDGNNLLTTQVFNADYAKQGNDITLRGSFPSIINLYTGKVDYTLPFHKKWKLETGIKTSFVDIDNEVLYQRDTSTGWFRDETRSNHFLYTENVNAAYVILSTTVKKWELSGGLRLENTIAKGTQVKGDSSFKRNYTNLFPNASVMYNVNEKNQFGLSYSRRIRRPDYNDLNPFVFFVDSLTYGQGNPYLQPEFSNNIELSHTFNKFLTTTVNYTRTDDIITEILKQNTDLRTVFQTKENFSKMRQWGVTITANKQLLKWWSTNVYFNLFDNKYNGLYNDGTKDYPIKINVGGFMTNMTNSFSFADTWSAELSGWYTNRLSEGLIIGRKMWALNMALAKQVLKKNGTIKIGVRDIFRTQNFSGYSRYANVDLDVYNDRRKDNRQFVISFTYKFGKNSIAPERRRSGGSNEEQNRIKSGGG